MSCYIDGEGNLAYLAGSQWRLDNLGIGTAGEHRQLPPRIGKRPGLVTGSREDLDRIGEQRPLRDRHPQWTVARRSTRDHAAPP